MGNCASNPNKAPDDAGKKRKTRPNLGDFSEEKDFTVDQLRCTIASGHAVLHNATGTKNGPASRMLSFRVGDMLTAMDSSEVQTC